MAGAKITEADKDKTRAAAYAAGAGAFKKAVRLACDFASEAGLTAHEQANELRTIAQGLEDSRGQA